MIGRRLAIAAMAALVTGLSGCAVNRATANIEPSADLAAIRTVHVVKLPQDERKINELIAERMTKMGFVATTDADPRPGVDATLTYADRWMWDITMYMLELTIVVRSPVNNFPLATGNSLHTSLTRLPPQAMVDEVLGNIFKGAKK